MAYDATRVESHINDILNAAPTFGAAITAGIRSAGATTNARIQSGWEVLRAIAANPNSSYFGSLAALVTVAHNALMPSYEGEPGIPVITPYNGGAVIDGVPAEPGQIDSYRASNLYTGAYDGVNVAHNAADSSQPSRMAGRYSIVNGRFKFTGYTAQIPLIQLTRAMADTGVPEAFEPTVVKLSITKLIKPGDAAHTLAAGYQQLALVDLQAIRGGAMEVPPVPGIEAAQKAGVI